ncbi:MAG TPA: 2-dehydropantoate 2-reductase N-terminal domain-containing protein [Sporichthyaceae bacterium]|nr:2-dehydropantoate 2-reductase N-terminal domain-containing protein [Sporichthyaceae bacterium]
MYVVCGAGAIGGVVAAKLALAGLDVTLLARGANYERIRTAGARLRTPTEDVVVEVPTVPAIRQLRPGPDVVVLLAVKSQDTFGLAQELVATLGADCPVACLQNGVDNERTVARFFDNVYATSVMAPNAHPRPGEFEAYAAPVMGVLEHGRYCGGSAAQLAALAADLGTAGFESRVAPDVMAVKYGKLLKNLGNAVEVICGPAARGGPLTEAAQDEGRRCLDGAGIRYEEQSRWSSLVKPQAIDGRDRVGSSTWQSVQQGGSTETAYLNGEIAMIARRTGTRAPINSELQRLVTAVVARPDTLGSYDEQEVLARCRPA